MIASGIDSGIAKEEWNVKPFDHDYHRPKEEEDQVY